MHIRLLLLVIFSVVVMTSCKKPQGFEYRDLRNFRVSGLGVDKSTVSMDLVYFNPNKYGVDLKHVDCDVYLNNTYVGKFILDTMMSIPREAEFTLPASMEVDMRNVYKNVLSTLFSSEVLIGAKGHTKIGKAGIFVNVPFSYEGRHKLGMF